MLEPARARRLPLVMAAFLCGLIFLFFPLLSARAAGGPASPLPEQDVAAAMLPPSLDVMLGSMLMLGFRGVELAPDDPFLEAVRAGRVGHVLLFDRDLPSGGGQRNIRCPEQLRRLTAMLRAASPGPMFIAVDQEGGRVRRLRPQQGFMDLPSARHMGRETLEATRSLAARLGAELAGLGISVDLAPVADVDSNPDNPAIGRLERSFSPDPAVAAAYALAFGQGLARSGVIPVLKHFPGQGCAQYDSHLGLTDISRCWDGGRDLLPYAEAFRQGWPGMVMVGHLFHARLDPTHPASLSKVMVSDLLRRGLGWQGVVISDDMQMKAITDHYGLEQAILLAVEAGVDILVFGNNLQWDPALPEKAHAALRRLVDSGKITPERVRASWERIAALHAAYASFTP